MRFMIGNWCVSVRNCPHDIFSRGKAQYENDVYTVKQIMW